MSNPTALQTLKEELSRVQEAQQECISECGVIINSRKYRYKILVEQAEHIRHSIEWIEALKD